MIELILACLGVLLPWLLGLAILGWPGGGGRRLGKSAVLPNNQPKTLGFPPLSPTYENSSRSRGLDKNATLPNDRPKMLGFSPFSPTYEGSLWVDKLVVLGSGYFVGFFGLSLVIRMTDGIDFLQSRWGLSGLVLLLSLILAVCGQKTRWWFWGAKIGRHPVQAGSRLATLLTLGLLGLLLWRLVILGWQTLHWPLFPWDAWASWGFKAKAWFLSGHLTDFLEAEDWLGGGSQTPYTVQVVDYPPTVSLIQFWMAKLIGVWRESFINLPWPAAFLALGTAYYGLLRRAVGTILLAMTGTYLLLSLPLLETHVALAGYADLWLCGCFGLAALALFDWLEQREIRYAWLALILALVCTQIKQEGLVWALMLLPPLLLGFLPTGRGLAIIMAGFVALLLIWVSGIVHLELPGGPLILNSQEIALPGLGHSRLAYQPLWSTLLREFFLERHWHLLWHGAVAALVLGTRPAFRHTALAAALLVLLQGLGFLFVLFFFSEHSAWARQVTAINRVALPLAPIIVYSMLLTWRAYLGSSSRPGSSAA